MTSVNVCKNYKAVRLFIVLIALACFEISSCKKDNDSTDTTTPPEEEKAPDLATARSWLADKNATEQTAALFYNLKKQAKSHILFGHQDDTKRGVGWANEEGQTYQPEKSDVKDVTGAFPSVYGWDFNFIAGNATGAYTCNIFLNRHG